MIQKGRLQKFVKKDYQVRQQTYKKSIDDQTEEDRDNLKPIVGEMRIITGGPIVGGSYKSPRKAVQRQVNSLHVNHPMTKHHCTGNDDIVFFERDVKAIK